VSLRDRVVKRKISSPYPGLELPIIQPIAQLYTTELSRLPNSIKRKSNEPILDM
jgi:hypothetical protein